MFVGCVQTIKLWWEIYAGCIAVAHTEKQSGEPSEYKANHEKRYLKLKPQSEINPYLNPRHVQRINIASRGDTMDVKNFTLMQFTSKQSHNDWINILIE